MPSAPLQPLATVASGIKGLNTQASATLLDPSWATTAMNMVFDSTGRLASRNGWSVLNSTPISGDPSIGQIFEYLPISGSNVVITAANNNLYTGTTTLTNVTGSLSITANNWKFVNFNGNVYGLQTGHPLIVWSGTGNFTTVTAATGTVPNGNELLGAFGRLWGSDSTGQLLKYSNLLDAANWNNTGSGSFNLTSVWGTGNDAIVSLAAFNNFLVVFGSRNIIIWADNSGSVLGMDPNLMFVNDQISGIGCVARDTTQNMNGEDLVTLTAAGLQSLKRLVIERSNETRNISVNVRDYLNASFAQETPANIRSTYNAYNGFYLLLLPTSQLLFAFDTRIPLQDGSLRATTWNNFIPQALYTLHDQATLYGGYNGQLFQYTGYFDNGGMFTSTFESGWLDLGEEANTRLKMLKRVRAVFSTGGQGIVTMKWAFDFNTNFTTYQTAYQSPVSNAQWGAQQPAQWGYSQWGGGSAIIEVEAPASQTGQYIKIGLNYQNPGSEFGLQQMQLYSKIGRIT
jgi:hypothetical protein